MQTIELNDYERLRQDPKGYFYRVWMMPWFQDLPDACKSHYLMLCDLALKCNNEIPADMKWIRQNTPARSKIDLDKLHKIDAISGGTPLQSDADENSYEGDFDGFWEYFPKRKGTDPKLPAARSYARARKDGVSHDEIMEGVRSYRKEAEDIEPQYICMAVTWLNQRRWEGAAKAPKQLPGGVAEAIKFKEMEASNFIKRGLFSEARNVYAQIERLKANA